APALVTPLRWDCDRLHSRGQSEPGAQYHSVSFALQNRIQFLVRCGLANKARGRFSTVHPEQRCDAMERVDSPPTNPVGSPFSWHRHLLCCPIYSFSLRGDVLHPTQPVRDLRFSRWFEFFCVDLKSEPRVGRSAVLPAASNPLGRGCRSTCDVGSRKPFCSKTRRQLSGNLRFVCRGLSGFSFPLSLQHTSSPYVWHPDGLESVADLGRFLFSHSIGPVSGVVDGGKAFR